MFVGEFPWRQLESKVNTRTFMDSHASNLANLIKNFGWDTTSELIACIDDPQTHARYLQIIEDHSELEARQDEFNKLCTDENESFTLSIVSGGHRFAALQLLDQKKIPGIPIKVKVRVMCQLDSLTFSFLSQRCNDNQHVTQPQMLIDRINQVYDLYYHLYLAGTTWAKENTATGSF